MRPEHSTLLGFLRGFSDAILPLAPDARKTLSAAYEANSASKTSGADLAMWMHSHFKGYDGLIAIDDLHFAESDPEVSRFLASLIDRTKPRTRWLLASRSTLDLPVGSWLAYGHMDLTVDEQDLRFTLEEAREAARAARVSVRDEELSELLSMTDGWPTALSFALRSSTRSVDLRNITASTREMVYRYLAEQVYNGLATDERALLHFISYLDEIDLAVLRKAGYTRAKGVIESLRDRVAFIYSERPSSYRCHDLFREFLQHQLEIQGDVAVAAVRYRVATALESANKVPAALNLFTQQESSSDVLRLIERYGLELIDLGHADVVRSALNVIPHDIRARNPIVLGIRGLASADSGRLDRAESLLQRAAANATDGKLKAALSIKLALILANQMKDSACVLEPLRNADLPDGLRGEITSLLAVSYAYGGRPHDAANAVTEADALVENVESDQDRARILHRLGIAMAQLGMPLDKVLAYQKQAAALAAEHGLFGLAGRAFSSLASIALLYEGDSTKEMWYAQQASTASMKAGDRVNLQTALLQLMDIEGRRGNAERLKALEKQLATVATSDLNRLVYVVAVKAFAAAWQGKFDEAHRLMATISGNTRLFDFDRTFNSASDALFLLADKRREEALRLTATTLADIERIDSPLPHARRQNEIAKLICVAVESLAGRRVNAHRILQGKHHDYGPAVQAVRDAVTTICRVGKGFSAAADLTDQVAGMTATGYGGLARVLELAVDRCLDRSAELPDSLTESQVYILEALAAGRTPKEIAGETGRSVYTIQTHIQNIIKRLGCSGRHEALMIARKRGLLA